MYEESHMKNIIALIVASGLFVGHTNAMQNVILVTNDGHRISVPIHMARLSITLNNQLQDILPTHAEKEIELPLPNVAKNVWERMYADMQGCTESPNVWNVPLEERTRIAEARVRSLVVPTLITEAERIRMVSLITQRADRGFPSRLIPRFNQDDYTLWEDNIKYFNGAHDLNIPELREYYAVAAAKYLVSDDCLRGLREADAADVAAADGQVSAYMKNTIYKYVSSDKTNQENQLPAQTLEQKVLIVLLERAKHRNDTQAISAPWVQHVLNTYTNPSDRTQIVETFSK